MLFYDYHDHEDRNKDHDGLYSHSDNLQTSFG